MLASVLTRDDFDAAGGDDTEGIVEIMRGVRGVEGGGAGARGRPGRRVARLAALGRPGRGRLGDRPATRAAAATGRRPASARAAPPDDLLAWLDARITERLDHLAANPNGAGG